MLLQIIFFSVLGIFFGTFTGLIPGIHINLLSILFIKINSKIFIDPIYSIIFIVSLAITHTFLDFIPSIFLGCPDTDTEMSILPGHKLLKNRRGYEAVYLSNLGGLIALGIFSLLVFPSIWIIPKIYPLIESAIPYILIATIFFTFIYEKRKIASLKVIFLAGTLGFCINLFDVTQPLLPLLTGLFGTSSIIISIKNKTKIPNQIITKPKLKLYRPIIASIFSAPICSFLPALGSGQAAIIGNILVKQSSKQFLILIGTINTLVMSYSVITFYILNKTRTGAMVIIKEIINTLETKHLILLWIVIVFVGLFAYFLTDILTKTIIKKFEKINYSKISYLTLLIIFLVNFFISGPKGIIVLIVATFTGIYCINQKVRRTHMMNALTIPTIIWLI